jgi:beta-N-acetylhexosaminidase
MSEGTKRTLRADVGSLFIVGLGGMELTNMERSWLRLVAPSGIILFRRNFETAAQSHALLDAACAECTPRAFRCVDVEGGMVNRLRDALAPIAAAQDVAKTGDKKLMRKHGELIADAVKAFGFNTSFAPVLDLALPDSAEVMGTRSPAATAEGVAEYGHEFLEGLAKRGVVGCGKHFPGLGGGTVDSHHLTPAIERSWKELWEQDLAPYRDLKKEMPFVMVNHAAYPQTKDKTRPATASKFWAKILHEKIGYKGIILSDDLEMGGILKFLPIDKAAVEVFRAGMDMALVCHNAELVIAAYEAVLSEAERSAEFRKIIVGRARFAARQRERLVAKKPAKALTALEYEALRAKIFVFNELVAKRQQA